MPHGYLPVPPAIPAVNVAHNNDMTKPLINSRHQCTRAVKQDMTVDFHGSANLTTGTMNVNITDVSGGQANADVTIEQLLVDIVQHSKGKDVYIRILDGGSHGWNRWVCLVLPHLLTSCGLFKAAMLTYYVKNHGQGKADSRFAGVHHKLVLHSIMVVDQVV